MTNLLYLLQIKNKNGKFTNNAFSMTINLDDRQAHDRIMHKEFKVYPNPLISPLCTSYIHLPPTWRYVFTHFYHIFFCPSTITLTYYLWTKWSHFASYLVTSKVSVFMGTYRCLGDEECRIQHCNLELKKNKRANGNVADRSNCEAVEVGLSSWAYILTSKQQNWISYKQIQGPHFCSKLQSHNKKKKLKTKPY